MPDSTSDTRDLITIRDEEGRSRQFAVEALFDMDDQTYALLKGEDDLMLMRVVEGEGDEEDEQYLEGIGDPEEAAAILDAYQLAVHAAPAE